MSTLTLPRPPATLPPDLTDLLAAKQAEAAEAARQARREENQALRRRFYGLLRDLGVNVFDRFDPLKVGIRHDLAALLDGEFTLFEIDRCMRWHVARLAYHQAVAAGDPRRDLDGNETGTPTDRERDHAAACVAAIRAGGRG